MGKGWAENGLFTPKGGGFVVKSPNSRSPFYLHRWMDDEAEGFVDDDTSQPNPVRLQSPERALGLFRQGRSVPSAFDSLRPSLSGALRRGAQCR